MPGTLSSVHVQTVERGTGKQSPSSPLYNGYGMHMISRVLHLRTATQTARLRIVPGGPETQVIIPPRREQRLRLKGGLAHVTWWLGLRLLGSDQRHNGWPGDAKQLGAATMRTIFQGLQRDL